MSKSNSKILVTGGLGYIGNEVVGELLKNGRSVVVNDRDPLAEEKFLPIWSNKIEYIHDDVCELKCPEGIDFVVHLAAEVGYVACEKKRKESIRTNVEGTKNIASFGKPTLFFSTGSVYGKVQGICTENSPCNPQTTYSKTKKEGEDILKAELADYCIVRPATAFGLSYKVRHDLLIHNLAKTAVEELKIVAYQQNAMRTFYHVNSMALFVEYCLSNWSQFSNKTFNLGHETGNVSKKEILDTIREFISFTKIEGDDSDPDQRDYSVNYEKIRRSWPSIPSLKIRSMVGEVVNYYIQVKNDRFNKKSS